MKDITFKISEYCEDNIQWLLSIAKEYSKTNKVYLVEENTIDYLTFCNTYFNMYHEVCPAIRFDHKIDDEAVILIDNLLKQSLSTTNIEFLQRNCYKMFITLVGTQEGSKTITQ